MKKTAVLYSFLGNHARSQENFAQFVSTGLVEGADYFLIGPEEKLAKLEFDRADFAGVIHDHDGVEHSRVTRFYQKYFQNFGYENLIVISSEMLGPYSTPGCPNSWIQKFINPLNGDTHLVGSNVIVLPADHPFAELHNKHNARVGVVPFIPTSAFAISCHGLELVVSSGLFNQNIANWNENLHFMHEIKLSHLILENGWNISCLLSKYAEIDFRVTKRDLNPNSCLGDPSIDGSYFGGQIEQGECIFVKTPNFKNETSYQDYKTDLDIKLYGIFYNDETRSALSENFIKLDNSRGPKFLYESYPIFNQLDKISFTDKTWVGFFSPKFEEKTKIGSQDIVNEINLAETDTSVILFSSHWKHVAYWPNIWLQGESHHPGLGKLSQHVAGLAGYSIDITKTYSNLENGVFSNYLVAKADFWTEWKRLVSIYYNLITECPELLNFSTPYLDQQVPIHTFIIERFPTMIILELGLKSKCCQHLYDRSLSHTSFSGSEAIKMDRYKRKFTETDDETYKALYNFHIKKYNERIELARNIQRRREQL